MKSSSQLDSDILEQMAEAVIYADKDGTIERWNAGAAQTFGFTAEQAIGQNLDLIIPDHLRATHWRGFEAAINNGKTRLNGRATLTRAMHKTGRKLYCEMSFALIRDSAGLAIGSVAVARDVTEKVEREKAAGKAVAGN